MRAKSFSTLPSLLACTEEMSIPFFSAKAKAALVGLPSASKAIAAGGPQISFSSEGVSLSNPSITKARRRGVAYLVILLHLIFCPSRPESIASENASIN